MFNSNFLNILSDFMLTGMVFDNTFDGDLQRAFVLSIAFTIALVLHNNQK
jgi:hypothetical protein